MRERMDEVRRPCLESVSTCVLSSSRIEDSSSILDCREVKIAGSTGWAAGAGVVMVVSSDIFEWRRSGRRN